MLYISTLVMSIHIGRFQFNGPLALVYIQKEQHGFTPIIVTVCLDITSHGM